MKCWKCNGTGNLPQYSHVENGVCFACDGDGTLSHTDRVILAKDYAKKGSRPSGSLSNLLKTEHEFLDKDELLKYRKALVRHAKKKGLKPKPGFHTAKLKKELQEMSGRDDKGMKPYEYPENQSPEPSKEDPDDYGKKLADYVNGFKKVAEEKKAAEEKKDFEFQATLPVKKPVSSDEILNGPKERRRVVEDDGVFEQPGAELYREGNNFYNKYGHQIISPFRRFVREDRDTAQLNYDKPMGSPFADFITEKLKDFMDREEKENFADPEKMRGFSQDMRDIAEDLENDFGGVLSNISLAEFNLLSGYNTVNGNYTVATEGKMQEMKMNINVNNLLEIHLYPEYSDNVSADRERARERVRQVLVHEIAHAFHHQALSDRDISAYTGHQLSKTPRANILSEHYKQKVKRLMEKGMEVSDIRNYQYVNRRKDLVDMVTEEFTRAYGAQNVMEMFATMSEALASRETREVFKKKYPADYEVLKQVYEGVITL